MDQVEFSVFDRSNDDGVKSEEPDFLLLHGKFFDRLGYGDEEQVQTDRKQFHNVMFSLHFVLISGLYYFRFTIQKRLIESIYHSIKLV